MQTLISHISKPKTTKFKDLKGAWALAAMVARSYPRHKAYTRVLLRWSLQENLHPVTLSKKPYLTLKEAATFLAIAERTLYNWVHQRQIPFRKHGRRLAFSLDDLAAWSEKRNVFSSEISFGETKLHGKRKLWQNRGQSSVKSEYKPNPDLR